MPEIVAVGPFMIRADLLAVILACAAGFAAMYIKLRRSDRSLLPLADVALTAAIIVFAGWKAGPLLSEPEMLWQAPLRIVSLPGAADGVLFGGILTLAYVLNRLRKLSIAIWAVLDAFAFFTLAGGLVYAFLAPHYGYETTLPWGFREVAGGAVYHPVHLYFAIVCAAGLAWAWIYAALGTGRVLRLALLCGGLGGLAVSLLVPQTAIIFMLSGWQLVCIAMALSAVYAGRIGLPQQAYTNSGKELSDMPKERSGDSIAQREQAKMNKTRRDQTSIDKKLDGPNRPST